MSNQRPGFGSPSDNNPKTFMSISANGWTIKASKQGEIFPATGQAATAREIEDKTTKAKRTVYEWVFPDFTANIESIIARKNENLGGAWQYVITMDFIGSKYVLNIPLESSYGDSFAARIPNIKHGVLTTLRPYNFDHKTERKKNGDPKKMIGVSVIQEEVKIESAFSRENPGNRPQMTENMTEVDLKIYNIKLREFYKSVANSWGPKTNEVSNVEDHAETAEGQDVDDDGLPF
jgi:hypothetical protein